MHRRRTALALVALGLTATACSAGTAATNDDGLPVIPDDAGHLHGIAVNPADGRLLLGTHVGAMAVTEDGVQSVGDATIDLMGFAVAGPDHFYASGHPGPDDDLPDPVGLIESTDGGRTWRSLSMAGRSDFHTLGASGDVVYGFDGAFRVTSGGTDWRVAAAGVVPASIAVHPTTPTTLVATTQDGPVRSTDGATTFTHLDDAPLLVFAAWVAPDALWAVDPDGVVHRSADSGATWEERGDAGGPPEAFTATADAVYVATGEGVLRSADGGRSFSPMAVRE